MTLRASLQRLARRDPDRPTLRERLAAGKARIADVKTRAALATKVGRIAFQPIKPEPKPVDRIALINYATWLAHERRLLCREIYPEVGPDAQRFIACIPAADNFHFPSDGRSRRDVPPPSSRAVQMLDHLGVDWRADRKERDELDPPRREPDDEPTPMPHGWPSPDGPLLSRLSDLLRADALMSAIEPDGDREPDELPEWEALDTVRDEAIAGLIHTRAEGLRGLQAKARILLSDTFGHDAGPAAEIALSLARDLTGARDDILDPRPDPIHAALAELEQREAVCAAEWERDKSDDGGPARKAAETAVFEQWRGVVLKTVPNTARGCTAFARFARAFHQRWAASLDQDGPTVLDLIARSPLL